MAVYVVVEGPVRMLDAVTVATLVLPLPNTVDEVDVDCVPPADGVLEEDCMVELSAGAELIPAVPMSVADG